MHRLPACARRAWAGALLLAALLVGAPALALDPDFRFPAQVAGFKQGPRTDYEGRAPGLGYSVKYTDGRWSADVYVYDLKQADIPEGPSAPAIRRQFAQARGDIDTAVRQGAYREVTDGPTFRVSAAGGRELGCEALTVTADQGARYTSLLCLTGMRGKFVKMRLSAPEAQASRPAAEAFLAAWLGGQ